MHHVSQKLKLKKAKVVLIEVEYIDVSSNHGTKPFSSTDTFFARLDTSQVVPELDVSGDSHPPA